MHLNARREVVRLPGGLELAPARGWMGPTFLIRAPIRLRDAIAEGSVGWPPPFQAIHLSSIVIVGLHSEGPDMSDLPQADQTPEPKPGPGRERSRVRFEATVHPGPSGDLGQIDKIDVFRVPSPDGQIRVLATPDELERLIDLGFELHLHRAYPIRPLDPTLIETDEAFQGWLTDWFREMRHDSGREGA
jgi:hypothetical protein